MLFYLLACQISSPQVQDNIIYSLLKKNLCFSNLSWAGVIWTKCVCTWNDKFRQVGGMNSQHFAHKFYHWPIAVMPFGRIHTAKQKCFKMCSSFHLLYRQSNLKCKYYLQISMPKTELLRMLLYVIFVIFVTEWIQLTVFPYINTLFQNMPVLHHMSRIDM